MTITDDHNTIECFNFLLKKGDIVQCPICNEYNAYCYLDSNMDVNSGLRLLPSDGFSDGGEEYTDDELLTNWPDVYEIGVSCMDSWQCRNCKTYLVKADSILTANVFTHCDE